MSGAEPGSTFVALPDVGQATTLDDLVEQLRLLKVWAGDPSYEIIKDRVNVRWSRAGRPAGEQVGKTTVVDAFRLGRRRLNADLVLAVVEALHPDPGYVGQWRQALRVVVGESRAAMQVRVQGDLPEDAAGFVGRAGELECLLREGRRGGLGPVICVIGGMAGVGKTRLAVHAAHLLIREQRFDRVLFVNLRGFHHDPAQPPANPGAVLDGFLRLLGVGGQQIPYDMDGRAALYRRRLAGTRALVVLDNAAHVDQVRPLLPGTPDCFALVTSRARLVVVPSAVHLTLDVFTVDEARRFLDQATPGLPVGEDDDAVARIAGRCGRLPLALALLASQMRGKAGWNLTDHAHWLDERHRDRRLDTGVELALDLSYQRLPADRRRLLRLLALHPAQDFDVYAAAGLADTDLDTARRLVRDLRDDHLLQHESAGRYAFHDLVRAYAAARAHDEDRPRERRAALTRLLDYYLATAAVAMDTLHAAEAHRRPRVLRPATPTPDLSDPDRAQEWLDTERAALVTVAAYSATHDWPAHATRLSSTLFRYLDGGHLGDAVTVHDHARRAADRAGDLAGAGAAETALGIAYTRLSRSDLAVEHLQLALALFRRQGDPNGQARALANLGIVEGSVGRQHTAVKHYRQALTLYRQVGDRIGEAYVLNNLGVVEMRAGHHRSATDRYRQALALFQRVDDRSGEATVLSSLGYVEMRQGRQRPAAAHLKQALELYRQLGHSYGEAQVLDILGLVHTRLDDPVLAAEHHERARGIFARVGDRGGQATAINGLGEAAQAAGQPAEAITRHTAAQTIAVDIDDRGQQARAQAGLGRAHDTLGNVSQARHHYQQALRLYCDLHLPDADEIRARLANLDLTKPPPRS